MPPGIFFWIRKHKSAILLDDKGDEQLRICPHQSRQTPSTRRGLLEGRGQAVLTGDLLKAGENVSEASPAKEVTPCKSALVYDRQDRSRR